MSRADAEIEMMIQNEIQRQKEAPVERRQTRLQKNSEERERYMTKLFRIVTKLRQLEVERKRLLGPNRKASGKVRKMTLDEIRERHAAGGNEFNDEIPS